MIHYRVHGEDFAVCGTTSGEMSDREEDTTCPECLIVNADAHRGDALVKRRTFVLFALQKLSRADLEKLITEIHECLWDPFDPEREVNGGDFIESVSTIFENNGLEPEDA